MSRRRSLFDNSLLFSPNDSTNNANTPSRSNFLSARLSSFSSEFATLFRSHTISGQKVTGLEFSRDAHEPVLTNKVLQSGYADNTATGQHTNSSQNVNSSPPPSQMQDERPSRKQKPENRFYNFLTRSRSRSRSKHDHETTTTPTPKSSSKSRSSSHQKPSNIQHHSLPSPPQSPGSKPVTRIQSRPLSSTTTATNTTITPATPKARRYNQALPGSPTSVRASRPATAPAVTAPVTARQVSNSNSTASSHQSQAPSKTARRKLHELFSLPLRRKSTSRSRSRSRPSTPVLLSQSDHPPLPIPVSPGLSLGFDTYEDDITPRPHSKASPPYPELDYVQMRTPSPTPGPRILKVMNPSTPTATPGSTTIKLPRIFSGSSKTTPAKQSSMDSATTTPPTPSTTSHPLPPLPTSNISHPIKRIPSQSHYRRSSASTATEGTYATPQNSSVVVNAVGMSSSSSLGHSKMNPPTIIHTPPTPLKPGENVSGNGTHPPPLPTKSGFGFGGSSRLGFQHHVHAMKGSLDSGYRYRINTSMGVVDEEGRASPARSSSVKVKGEVRTNGKEKERETAPTPAPSTVPRVSTTKMSSAVRATKHGSFDFERPGAWASAALSGVPGVQRTGSNSTTGSGASGHLGYDLALKKERESTYGPGLAGVGTLQREVSMRRAKEREDELKRKEEEEKRKEKERERAKRRASSNERREKEKRPLTANSSQRTTPTGSDHAHGSTSTNGKGSSWGKAAGKRSKTASGGGVTRITMTAHHPLFDFEPPVPSPTRSTGSTSGHGQANNGVYSNGYSAYGSLYYEKAAEKEQQRLRDEKERYSSKKGSEKDKSAVPVPSLPSPIATIPSGTTSSGGVPVTSAAAIGSLSKPNTMLIQKPLPPISIHQPPMYNATGHRSGTKGRSLDLNLGLAWAPSKVRADALLPSSNLFARSASQGGGNRRGRSGIGNGSVEISRSASGESSRGHGYGGKGDGGDLNGVERSKLGREVAELFRSALDKDGYALFKNYVHRFDAHEIPFDGPNGIVTLVQRLLVNAPHLEEEGRSRLLDRFIRIILQQA
ncbi:hypothetical protein CVT24_010618 [Panaeolus cyanescens]|uniref:Uncharacterized protein n=1 Tax=Panaeolus cyanescens TaxID=181874 RepID=A0A409YLT0_9AGAR|nr:hypothetical protein CVT24_010618 [Panaeolus cyanescens]